MKMIVIALAAVAAVATSFPAQAQMVRGQDPSSVVRALAAVAMSNHAMNPLRPPAVARRRFARPQ